MSTTTPPVTLEELQARVAILEAQVNGLLQQLKTPPKKDWRSTLGMLTDVPGAMAGFDEALRIRNADYEAARSDPHYYDRQLE